MPDRPVPGSLEQRSAPVEGTAPTIKGNRLCGLIPVNLESRDLGGWTERLAPGCLTNADRSRLVVNVDHGGLPLGRFPSTLTLEDRDDGLAWSVDLPQSRADVREAIERGDLDATSWRMVVGRDRWEGSRRIVDEIRELHDVAVVVNAAYPTHAELRSAPEPEPAAPAPDPPEQEAPVHDLPSGGGLRVEDRAAQDEATVETRILEALRGVPKGEARALTTAVAVAPAEIGSYLFDRLRAASVGLSTGMTVLTTDRDSIVYPTLTADVVPAWYAEAAPILPGDPIFATLTATPHKLAHLVQMSNEVLDDSEPSILDVLNAHLLRVLALKLDIGLFEGSGTAPEIRGLRNVPGIQTIAAGANGAEPTLDLVADALALLEAANTAATAIVMPARTFGKLRTVKDNNGQYLTGSPTTATARTLFGVPVYSSGQLSTTEAQGSSTDASSIYVYNAAEVVYVRRTEIELELDRSRLFNSDQSELRAKLRGDLICPNPSAICRIVGVL